MKFYQNTMTNEQSNLKSISQMENLERTSEHLQPDPEGEPPELIKYEGDTVLTYKSIQNLYEDYRDNDEELTEHQKDVVFTYLRHKSYFIQKGKVFEGSKKQYKNALKMAMEMEVVE